MWKDRVMKDLRKTEDLSPADFQRILEVAADFADRPLSYSDHLAHQTVGVYMTKPSTRTRLATETAITHLGGTPIFMRGDELQLGRGETLEDTAKIMSGFLRALLIRTYAQSDVDRLAAAATIPIINGLTDEDHPTQVLADWVTIKEEFGNSYQDRKYTYLGDGNNVAHAWLIAGALMGVEVCIATPPGKYQLPENSIKVAQEIAQSTGARIELSNDPFEAAKNSSVLYTDVWISMGDSEAQREEKTVALTNFQINEKLMKEIKSDGIFLHCLPAHRGEEVTAEVIDGERSRIWREAFHRRTTIQAALYLLTAGEIEGR